jgi:hypothetical protein
MPNIHYTSKNILRMHCGEYDRYSPHVSESTWEVLQSFNIVRGWAAGNLHRPDGFLRYPFKGDDIIHLKNLKYVWLEVL